jgi:hypothetical protein
MLADMIGLILYFRVAVYLVIVTFPRSRNPGPTARPEVSSTAPTFQLQFHILGQALCLLVFVFVGVPQFQGYHQNERACATCSSCQSALSHLIITRLNVPPPLRHSLSLTRPWTDSCLGPCPASRLLRFAWHAGWYTSRSSLARA